MDLTKEEKETLDGILRTEIKELKSLIRTASAKDKKELEEELKIVESIVSKLNN